jgi:hypothetical protein
MRTLTLFTVVFLGIAGCAHQRPQTIYQVGNRGVVAIGERHGDQIWFYDGKVGFVAANQHVKLPTFQDAKLVGDRLFMTPDGGEIRGNYLPRSASF